MGKFSTDQGKLGERLAGEHLRGSGYQILDKNFRGGKGEIDIVARKNGITYFVEVKARKVDSMVNPAEAITPDKKRRLKDAIMHWLGKNGKMDKPSSFLLVTVILPTETEKAVIEVIEDYI